MELFVALAADMTSKSISDKKVFILRAVGIMAAGTGKFSIWASRITIASNRMSSHRMASFNAFKCGMATNAQLVNGFCQNKAFF